MVLERKKASAALIAILMSTCMLLACGLTENREKQRIDRARQDLKILAGAVESFQKEYGYPPLISDIELLISQIAPTFIKNPPRTDPWGEAYGYDFDRKELTYSIWSAGPDGRPSALHALKDEIVFSNGSITLGAELESGDGGLAGLYIRGLGTPVWLFGILVYFVTIAISTAWVAIDAARQMEGIPKPVKKEIGGASNPVHWALGCFFLWIICFPWYLSTRSKYRDFKMIAESYRTNPEMRKAGGKVKNEAFENGEAAQAIGKPGPAQTTANPSGYTRLTINRRIVGGLEFGFKFALGFWVFNVLLVLVLFGIWAIIGPLEGVAEWLDKFFSP
ncbi:type II secretion system protein GspG [Acidobacteriota bacterium]